MSMDFSDIVDQLEADPGFRARLRAVVLSEELLEAPGRLARLDERVAELDARLTGRLDALAAAVASLADRVDVVAATVASLADRVDVVAATVASLADRVDVVAATVASLADRVDALTSLGERMDALTAAVAAQGERMDALTAAVAAQGERMDALTAAVAAQGERMDLVAQRLGLVGDSVASLKGSHFEDQVAAHPARYLAAVLDRPRLRPVESFDLEVLEGDEVRRLVRVDAIVSGRPAKGRGRSEGATESAIGTELLAAIEVSWRVHRDDLVRARDRAALLARSTGSPVLPVALSKVDPGEAVIEAAEELEVELVVDDGEPPRARGRVLAPAS